MRYLELFEATTSPGMLAVKADLDAKINDETLSPEDHEKLVDQWGIMDDLWIEEDGSLNLYRVVRLMQPWERNLKSRGHSYWSTSAIGAGPYNASDKSLKNSVDVTIGATLRSRLKLDWFEVWDNILGHHDAGENELSLGTGVPLTIFGIWVAGTQIYDSPLIGKRVIA